MSTDRNSLDKDLERLDAVLTDLYYHEKDLNAGEVLISKNLSHLLNLFLIDIKMQLREERMKEVWRHNPITKKPI